MNAFMSQNVQTMSELMDLAAVPYMIIASRDGEPIIEIVQDSLLGAFRLTKDWTRILEKTMANLQMVNTYFGGKMPTFGDEEAKQYTGKQAFSQILPPELFIQTRNKAGESVKIENSLMTSGWLDKKVFHDISKGIIPVLFHDRNPFEAARFIDNIQHLIMRWLTTAGFSVGISDLVTDTETGQKIRDTIHNFKQKAYVNLEDVRQGRWENNSIFNNEDFFEQEMLSLLNKLTKEIEGVCLKQINDKNNRMINMVKSGSKGKETNVAQMIGCVGQQNVDGKRVVYGFTDRTLPHYSKYDDGPEARGFVGNSFISGLTPQEVFFHAISGREGLIDTAVKTSETGYIQRRLVKAMEDCKIYYDQTVRNAQGAIVQFLYGEDGMDGAKVEKQHVPIIDMNLINIDTRYYLRPEDPLGLFMTEEAQERMKNEPQWIDEAREHYEAILADREFLIEKVFGGGKNDKIQYPIPFERIIRTALHRMNSMGIQGVPTDLTPHDVLHAIQDLTERLYILRPGQGIRFLQILIRIYLSPKIMILDYRMSKPMFEWIVSEIERCFILSVAQAGEMVGIVSAQTIGELSTQATLDSFHSSGTAAAVKATSGVPRLKELLSVSKNIKTPTMFIYLKPDIGAVKNPTEDADGQSNDPRMQESKERAMKVMQQLETTRLINIVESTEIFWDPPGATGYATEIEEDNAFLEVYREFATVRHCNATSPWLLRIKVNKEALRRAGLTMMEVYLRLHSAYTQQIECVFTDDNATNLIFRIRMTLDAMKDIDEDDSIAALKAMEHNLLHSVILKGTKGIKKVSMRTQLSEKYDVAIDQFDKVKEWMLDTDGTNMVELFSNPNVDAYRTRSNDIWEIFDALGIEAARNALFHEFVEVIGEKVNYRHLSLLLDTMTNRGTLMSIDRHGINRGDVGPLAKCSFEETTDMLINASVFAEYDKINGVSANIMLGQLPPCGTGEHEVLLDEEAYLRLLEEKGSTGPSGPTNINAEEAIPYEACGADVISMPFQVSSKQMKHIEMPEITFA